MPQMLNRKLVTLISCKSVRTVASLNEDAGETSGNLPSKRCETENARGYFGRGGRTSYVVAHSSSVRLYDKASLSLGVELRHGREAEFKRPARRLMARGEELFSGDGSTRTECRLGLSWCLVLGFATRMIAQSSCVPSAGER
ncbi:unnamed protein product [Protopolystoma xenopodis]|uniref:Uncharacterized protein n=1 Tax=Protopolystoma xenopodis TaxID=117903 RepID=A0A448XM95_9PLAT|nr:unnamed protein product [Protopolystoma xenopodis]